MSTSSGNEISADGILGAQTLIGVKNPVSTTPRSIRGFLPTDTFLANDEGIPDGDPL
jgi:hypothetical protein